MWQDLIFCIGSILFIVGLIPSVRGKQKPPKSTCVITGLTLLTFAITYATLGLWLSFITTLITSTMWLVLLVQQK
jgi:hypothetical protein